MVLLQRSKGSNLEFESDEIRKWPQFAIKLLLRQAEVLIRRIAYDFSLNEAVFRTNTFLPSPKTELLSAKT